MNILIAINNNYIKQAIILLRSIINNSNSVVNVFVMHKSLSIDDINNIVSVFDNKISINFIKISDEDLASFPVFQKRYPKEIYFRLLAAKYLPSDIDRVLYLDVDIIIISSIDDFYNMDFENKLFIGASHVNNFMLKLNSIRLGVSKNNIYLNTGVLLMNLKELRKIDVINEVISFAKNNRYKLMLPDQDIIYSLYGDKVINVSKYKYNISDRDIFFYNLFHKDKIDLDWINKNTSIIHYYGKNKPWNKKYRGILKCFYDKYTK